MLMLMLMFVSIDVIVSHVSIPMLVPKTNLARRILTKSKLSFIHVWNAMLNDTTLAMI